MAWSAMVAAGWVSAAAMGGVVDAQSGTGNPRDESSKALEIGAASAASPSAAKPSAEDGDLLAYWSRRVELGVNGSDGNSENFNLRAGAEFERVTDRHETLVGLLYSYATSDGDSTKNRLEAQGKSDFLLGPSSPWSVFVQGKFEYDEFQRWKYRTQTFGGLGYAFVKEEWRLVRGRVGSGVQHEFGKDARNEFIPEGLLGLDVEWKATERTSLFAMAEYYPSFEHAGDYRALARAGLEVLVDPALRMSLRLGVEDRYNSQPGAGKARNDVEYFITLSFAF